MIKELEHSLRDFPKTCLLTGNDNIVKDRFVEEFINKYNTQYEDITNDLNLDYINEIYTRNGLYLYHIDADKLTIKNQNVILKFIEEPLQNCFIFLRTKNTQNIIPTIKGRCYILNLGQFSKKYIDLINTEEDKQIADNYNIEDIRELCNSIFDNINKATLSNALTLVDKITLNYDSVFFSQCLAIIAEERYVDKNDAIRYNQYILSKKLYYNMNISIFNKQDLLSNYICELKKLV